MENQFHIPSFVTPCLPGIKHEYYGNYHLHYSNVSSGLVMLTDESFFSAIKSGDVSLVKKFFPKFKELINVIKTQSGLYPLHLATLKGYFEIVKYLVEEGAMVNLVDNENDTPLLKASYNGYENITQYLIKNNANVNYKDQEGWTALHNSCSRGFCETSQILINAGADVNCQNVTGQTPLMNACAKGYLNVVQLLIMTNANPLLKNNIGENAYDRAAQNEHSIICIIIEEYEKEYIKKNGIENEKISHNAVLEILYENQRSSYLPPFNFSSANLLKSDTCGPWSTIDGTPCKMEEVTLPKSNSGNTSGWFWMTDWTLDINNPYANSKDGWQYAKNFDEKPESWQQEPLSVLLNKCVRRRSWIRVRKRKYVALKAEKIDISNNSISQSPKQTNNFASTSISNNMSNNASTSNITKNVNNSNNAIIKNKINDDNMNNDNSNCNSVNGDVNKTTNTIENEPLTESTKRYMEKAKSIVQENIYSWDMIIKPTTSIDLMKEQFNRYKDGIEYLLKNNKEKRQIDSIEISNQIESYLKKAEILKERIDSLSVDTNTNENQENKNENNNCYSECSTPETFLSNQQNWEADSDAPICNSCNVKFSLFNRRHHCRKCGLVFCAKCSNFKYPLKSETTPIRLCKECYDSIKENEEQQNNNERNNALSEVNNDNTIKLKNSPNNENNEGDDSNDELIDCPVCGKSLSLYGSNQNNIESHLKTCLENENMEKKIKLGNKYELQKLDKNLEKECPICFEEFLKDQVIVRIDCLCIFHKKCIEEWYKYSKVDGICPIHSIDN